MEIAGSHGIIFTAATAGLVRSLLHSVVPQSGSPGQLGSFALRLVDSVLVWTRCIFMLHLVYGQQSGSGWCLFSMHFLGYLVISSGRLHCFLQGNVLCCFQQTHPSALT